MPRTVPAERDKLVHVREDGVDVRPGNRADTDRFRPADDILLLLKPPH